MIRSTRQIYLMRIGCTVVPANFGGDSDSNSSTNTTNKVTNNTQSNDKRAVASDNAVSLTGDGNSIDRSQNSVTSFFDASDRSQTTTFSDFSNRSTNFADSSNRSSTSNTTTNNTTTDYGSVNGALSLADSMTKRAFGTADGAFSSAVDMLALQSKSSAAATAGVFDLAAKQNATSAAVLGFATDAIKQTGAAFAEAKDGGQSKMVMGALVVVGVIGVAFALR